MLDPTATYDVAAHGLNASPGAACGAIVLDADTAEEHGKAGESVILVGWETSPDDIHGMIWSKGVLTAHGGMTSHAAVVARGHGQAVRRRLRRAEHRRRHEDGADREPRAARGRHDHDRRRQRQRDHRRGLARAAADQRGLRDDPRLGRRRPPAEGARERGQRGGLGEGARVRRPGDRALPHRAHVLRRGAAAGDAGDDPRPRRGGPALGARPPAPVPAVGLRGDLRGDGGAAGDDPPARSAAARVPAADRGRDRRADAPADPPAARGEPDARYARLPARYPVAGDLRDAGARDRARRASRPGANGRGAARRDHAPARRLRRGAAPAARAHRSRSCRRRRRRSSTCAAR